MMCVFFILEEEKNKSKIQCNNKGNEMNNGTKKTQAQENTQHNEQETHKITQMNNQKSNTSTTQTLFF